MSIVERGLVPAVAALVDGNNVMTSEYVPAEVMQHAGPPGRNYAKPRVYEGNNRTHTQLRDSYEDSSVVLDYAIRGMILEAPDAFVTVIYPAQEANELNYTYNSFKFNHVYVPEVPEEGVPRVVTASRRTARVPMRRRALAIRGEVTAMSTAMGVEEFTLRARGMALCIVETMIMDTLFEIVYSGSLNLTETNLYGADNVVSQALRERELTASLNRDPQQLALFVVKFRRFLSHNRKVAGPYCLIFAPETAMYIQNQNRLMGRDDGYALKRELASASELSLSQPVDYVMGMAVYESPDLYVGSPMYGRSGSGALNATAQMLTRHKVLAEHYLMKFGDRRNDRLFDGIKCKDESKRYHTSDRDVLLYDADADDLVRVTFYDAVIASRIGDLSIFPGVQSYDLTFKESDHMDSRRRGTLLNMYYDTRAEFSKSPVKKVRYAGQMDANVYTTRDLEQGASSVLGNVECVEELCEVYQKTVRLLRILEAVKPTPEYVNAHMAANQNSDENPTVVDPDAAEANGWTSMTQYLGSEAGGMILPVKGQGMDNMLVPPFLANWTGLKQLELLANSNLRGWSEEVCRMAAEVVPVWERIHNRLRMANSGNPLTNDRYRFGWEASAEAGTSLFALAFGSRIPVFYGVVGQYGGAEAETEVVGLKLNAISGSIPVEGKADLDHLVGRTGLPPNQLVESKFFLPFNKLGGNLAHLWLKLLWTMDDESRAAVEALADLLNNSDQATARGIMQAILDEVVPAPARGRRTGQAIVNSLNDLQGVPPGEIVILLGPSIDGTRAPGVAPPGASVGIANLIETSSSQSARRAAQGGYKRTPYTASPSQVREIIRWGPNGVARIGDPTTHYDRDYVPDGNGDLWLNDVTEMLPLESRERFQSIRKVRPGFNVVETMIENERSAAVGSFNRGGDEFVGGLYDNAGYDGAARQGQVSELGAIIDDFEVPNMQERIRAAGTERDGVLRTIMLALLGFDISDRDSLTSMLDTDTHIWFLNILLMMPAAEFIFDSSVLMKPGSETGVNLFGHQSMMYGANAIVQNFVGSYALYTKAFTKEEENMIAIMDWRVRGYVGGASTRFFAPDSDVTAEIEGPAPDRPGLVAFPLAITEENIPSVISPSGFFANTDGLTAEYQGAHFSSAAYYDRYVYEFSKMLVNRDAHMDRPFHQDQPQLPITCLAGQVVSFVPGKGFSKIEYARSWRDVGCYPGALSVYNGERTYFPRRADLDAAIFAGRVH